MTLLSKGQRRLYAIFEETLVFFVNCARHLPFHSLRRFIYTLSGIKMGRGSTIHTRAIFYTLGGINIGQDTIIGEGATLDGRGKLNIGSHVDIASEVMIYTSQHDIDAPDFRPVYEPVVIKDYVFIGPRAIILPGVIINKGAVVAAGAVVTKDVAENVIVAGVPAREIGRRQLANPTYRLGRTRLFR